MDFFSSILLVLSVGEGLPVKAFQTNNILVRLYCGVFLDVYQGEKAPSTEILRLVVQERHWFRWSMHKWIGT